MGSGNDSILDMYLYETNTLLEQLDGILLTAEQADTFSEDSVNEIFRIMHTIKGSSAMMEFSSLMTVAHRIEDMFFIVREKGMDVVPEATRPDLFDMLFQAVDFFRGEIEKVENDEPLSQSIDHIVNKINSLIDKIQGNPTSSEPEPAAEAESAPAAPAESAPAVEQFWKDYEAEFPKGDNAKALDELALAKKMLKLAGKPWFTAGGFFDGDKLIALALAERCGDTLIIHIEKALYSYTGVYPAFVQAFALAFGGNCQWIDREDDAADKGLRTSKLQYGPARLASKFRFEPMNELMRHITSIPKVETARLTLSALTEKDIPAYNALVLDQERNRWWGYDDVAGLGGPVEERSFYNVAKRDFENRLAVNFAVRLEGKLIGEAVLYNFDCRGGAELGCRIDRAYAGNGYGVEAFTAAAEWGLYKLHLGRVFAKCFKENQASYKMLSACMRKNGEDETFFYFEKLV